MNLPENEGVGSPSAVFFRFGAAAAATAVFGIVLAQLVFIPDEPEPGVAGLIGAYADPIFQAQSLTILLQVIAMFVALLIVAMKVFPGSPGATVLAVAFLFFWQVFEMCPRAIDYFTFSRSYAESYVAGSTNAASVEAEFRRFLDAAAGIRSMRQIVWSAALLLLGVAVMSVRGIGQWVAALLFLNGARVAMTFTLSMAGTALPFGRWAFIAVNTALFSVLTYWLWIMPWQERTADG